MEERPYLSIGEVLGMLLDEFPDISISKIRFLESQGLIDPERTPSGYRKFYDADVDRLRVILREQRQNFLPLRVIRDRLESGQIDDSGPVTAPRGLRNVTLLEADTDETGELVVPPDTVVPTRHHPAALKAPANGQSSASDRELSDGPAHDVTDGVFVASEFCSLAGITAAQLTDLRSYGIVTGRGTGSAAVYTSSDLDIAKAAAGFLKLGVDARHLRQWRQSAERESALFEQLVVPLIRQRNPKSREQAAMLLHDLSAFGGELRAAILTDVLHHQIEL